MDKSSGVETLRVGAQSLPKRENSWIQVEYRKGNAFREDPHIYFSTYEYTDKFQGVRTGLELTPNEALLLAQWLIVAARKVVNDVIVSNS